jgi:hypothetical protein
MLRAFKIEMKHGPDWSIYIANSAAQAKADMVRDASEGDRDATFAWIKSCRRAPAFDDLARYGRDCQAWQWGDDSWCINKTHPAFVAAIAD